MSDFTAKVVAQLDTSKIPSQLSQLQSTISKTKFVMQVDTSAAKELNQVKAAYNDLMQLQKRINSTRVKLSGLDANKDKAQISALSGQLNRLMTDYNNLYATTSRKLSTTQLDNLSRGFEVATNKIAALNAKASDVKGVEKLERSFTRLKDIVSQMGKIQLKISGLDASKNATEISQLTTQFKDLESQYTRLKASLKTKMSGVQSSEISNALKNTQNQLAQLDAKAQDTKRRLTEAINIKVSDGSLSSSIAKVTKEYERLATTGHGKLNEIKSDIEALNQIQSKLGKSSDVNELIANYNKFNSTLSRVKNGLSTVSAESKTFASSLQISTLDNKIAAWMEKNTKAAKTYGKSLDELRTKLAALSNSGSPVPVSSVNAIEQDFNSITQAAIASGKTGKTWGSTFKDSFKSISKYVSASTIIYSGIRGLKDMYQNVTNIDSAMVELKKVTDETEESYSTFLSGTNKKAQEIGTTITGLVSSTADFARLGYNFEDSQRLAEVANIYAVVGDEVADVDTATESIISTMKAFGVQTQDSISIVDKFNEVGNNFAISSGGIGEAMKRSASSMAAANNTIDETIALITAANTVVQNPEKVGTAFKTISMRIRGAKTELEEAGESTEGMAESTAKLQAEIKALSGVDIMKNKDEFKSTYQIMDELSQKWSQLTDIQQASIIELLAGKHQGNVMASLMTNFDEARKALAVSMSSEGSAMKEHEKWLNSVEAKQLQLQAAWEGLSQDFLSADFVKLGVDALRGIVNGVDSVVNAIGSVGTVAAGVGAFGLKKFIGAKGLGGLATIATAIPAPILVVAGAITAVGVAAIATKKHLDKLDTGAYLNKDVKKIKEHSDNIIELQNLMSEVESLELVINTSSSQEEINKAKQRIQEIVNMLNEKYELKVSADDIGEIKKELRILSQDERNKLQDDIDTYETHLEKTKYKEAKSEYNDNQERLNTINDFVYRAGRLADRHRIANETDDVDSMTTQLRKIKSDAEALAKEMEDAGFAGFAERVRREQYGAVGLDGSSEIESLTKKIAKQKETIDNFENSSKEYTDAMSRLLASSVNSGINDLITADKLDITNHAKMLKELGNDTDYISQKYAIASQGFTDFQEAINEGKLDDVVQTYIDFKKEVGETSKNAVQGAALLKQGFTDVSQVTAASVSNIYKDMKELGEKYGLTTQDAIENTALLASGFKNVEEATKAGNDGITKVLSNASNLFSQEGIFTDDTSLDDKAKTLSDFAHTVGLLPDSKTIKIDAETGNLSVVTDVTQQILSLWDNEKNELNISVNTEVDQTGIDDFDKKVEALNNKSCKIIFNADGSPARATIGDVQYDLKNYDETTGTATLLAEGGEAIGTIDLVNGKIELIPERKVIEFSANYNGIEGIDKYLSEIDELSKGGDISFNINASGNVDVLNDTGQIIANLKKDKNIAFSVNADGNLEVINTLTREIQTLKKNGDIAVTAVAKVKNLGEIEGLKGDFSELNGKECNVIFNGDDTPLVAKIGETNYLISNYNAQQGTATLTAENGQAIATINLTTGQINAIPDKTANVNANVTGTGDVQQLDNTIENTNSKAVTVSATTSGESALSRLKSLIDGIKSKVVNVVAKVFGGGGVDGTAHVHGTAYSTGTAKSRHKYGRALKNGDWGTTSDGIALGGELGEELVVRDGKFFTIGAQSAEFFKYKKDDIIFNAEQTKQIFEKGRITHGKRRGRALAEGTAFASGENKAEDFDWIEILLNRSKSNYDSYKNNFDSEFNSLKDKFNNFSLSLQELNNLISLQQSAYNKYIEKANSIGLSEEYAQKVRDGSLDISSVSDDDLKEKINDYKTWYEKALDCKDAVSELNEESKNLYKGNLENIIAAYDNIISEIEHKSDLLDSYINKAEQNGLLQSTRYYEALSNVETETLAQLEYKRNDLINSLAEAVNNGQITEYTDAWYELKGAINDTSKAIAESEAALAEFNKEMRQIEWDRFDYAQDTFSGLSDEADFLIELLGDDFYVDDAAQIISLISDMQYNSSKWNSTSSYQKNILERSNRKKAAEIEDITGKDTHIDSNGVWWIGNQKLYSYRNGQLNDSGMAAMGLHGMKYNVYMEQSLSYGKELSKIESELANNPYDTNLIARRKELLDLQRESILAAEDEKNAIIDMVEEGISVELDALQELIDKYNDSLDSAKDLYDYQQSILEHTDNIASIQKQLSAYANDNSEETKAKVQQLKVDLEEAQQNLKDTEYDRYISDQKELLDSIYNDYEEILNKRLDNVDSLVSHMIDSINDNSSSINSTLVSETAKVGTKISDDMNSIWTAENVALNNYLNSGNSLLGGFALNANGYFSTTSVEISGINTTLTSILTDVNTIMEYASIMAKVDIDPEGSKNHMIQNSLDWWAASDDETRNTLAAENEKYGSAFGYTKNDGSWYDKNGNLAYSVSDDDKIRNVIAKMKANSASWSGASAAERSKLEQSNITYANKIASLTGKSVYKDGNGVWWIDDKELYSYKTGGLANFTGAAWLDGTPNQPELVLNAQDTANFIELKDTLRALTKQGVNLSSTGYSNIGAVSQLSKLSSISDILSSIRNQNNNQNNKSIGDINISIPIEHVDDYNDFITQLQKDKQFEKFIRSVSVDLLSGGSSLAKNKYKW